jgi:hypothetical protein
MEDTESSHAEMLPLEPLSGRLRRLVRHFSAILFGNSKKTNQSRLYDNYRNVDIKCFYR